MARCADRILYYAERPAVAYPPIWTTTYPEGPAAARFETQGNQDGVAQTVIGITASLSREYLDNWVCPWTYVRCAAATAIGSKQLARHPPLCRGPGASRLWDRDPAEVATALDCGAVIQTADATRHRQINKWTGLSGTWGHRSVPIRVTWSADDLFGLPMGLVWSSSVAGSTIDTSREGKYNGIGR